MNRAPVLVLGASSQIGIFTLPRLVAKGFEVQAINRDGCPDWFPRLPGVHWIRLDDIRQPAGAAPDSIISAGPLDLAVQVLKRGIRPRRVVAFSTTSVYSKSASRDPGERETMRRIVESESVLSEQCQRFESQLTILRPTLVYGAGLDQSLTRVARWVERFGFMPVAGAASGLRQPVHADDLAAAAVAASDLALPSIADTPLCGGETLTYREMTARVFSALGKPERIIGLPTWLFASAVQFARLVPALRGLQPEMVRRQRRDLIFDDAPARVALDWRPRPFKPAKADFRVPESKRLERMAGGATA